MWDTDTFIYVIGDRICNRQTLWYCRANQLVLVWISQGWSSIAFICMLSFTILLFKGTANILAHYTGLLENYFFYCFYFQSPVFSLYLSVLFFMWWIMFCANAGFFVWGLWWFFSFGQWSVPYSCRKLRKRSRAELLFLTASSVRVSDVCLLRWVIACPVPLLLTSWARHEFFP